MLQLISQRSLFQAIEMDKEQEETTWVQVGELVKEFIDKLEQQQEERVRKLREALEEVE